MAFSKKNRLNTFNGIWFVALFAMASTYLSEFSFFKDLGISPLILAIVIGAIYGNTLRGNLPKEWDAGIIFSTKKILRFAIVIYGFKITYQQIINVGLEGLVVDVIMLTTTFLLGAIVGIKLFKLDKDLSFLTASGASVCGAAAVLATEPVVKAEAYKSALAVSTVVLFGSISMFLYPIMYKAGWLDMDMRTFGIYIGATVHEVANVVAAGGAIGGETADTAIIVKMARVMMIAPLLIILGIWLSKTSKTNNGEKAKIVIPWFVIYFLIVAGFNSLHLLPLELVNTINSIDTFLLTMAMAGLGIETNIKKFQGVGMKPIYLAGIMWLWLVIGGYFITKIVVEFM